MSTSEDKNFPGACPARDVKTTTACQTDRLLHVGCQCSEFRRQEGPDEVEHLLAVPETVRPRLWPALVLAASLRPLQAGDVAIHAHQVTDFVHFLDAIFRVPVVGNVG